MTANKALIEYAVHPKEKATGVSPRPTNCASAS